MFLMTSDCGRHGNKALTYFEDTLEQTHATFDKLVQAGERLRLRIDESDLVMRRS